MRYLKYVVRPVSAGMLWASSTVAQGSDSLRAPLPWCDANLEHYAAEHDLTRRAQNILTSAWRCWLHYDSYEDRNNAAGSSGSVSDDAQRWNPGVAMPKFSDPSMSISAAGGSRLLLPVEQVMLIAASKLRERYKPFPFDVAGETDYLKAMLLAQEAYRIAPDNRDAFRLLAQLAVARSRWSELQSLAADYLRRNPRDAWARMTHALASYRLTPGKDARARFDSALAVMDAKERSRLDRFERLLKPKEAPVFARLDSAARATTVRANWLLADPLWSTKQADPRAEFLARVTFAELRWSLDDKRRGADTDRGDIYVRYGPPNQVMSSVGKNTQIGSLFWVYNAGIAFAFTKQMHYGTAKFNDADLELVDRMKDWVPARWDNIATSRIDSMPTQLARFRSGPDTVEVFLATRAPMEALRLVALDNVAPQAHLWLYGLDAPAAFVDSVTVGTSGRLQWTRRLGAGAYYYRVESTVPNTAVAGRAAAAMQMGVDTTTGFAMRGFGVSDVLLATSISEVRAPRRWIDLQAEPLLGDVKRGAQLSLVWENYELGQRNQSAQYDVSVTIDRGQSAVGKIAAKIVGALAGAVGVEVSDDRLAMTFERTVPYAPTIVDNITIALGETPPGRYLMTLRISDRVTGRATSRAVMLTIVE